MTEMNLMILLFLREITEKRVKGRSKVLKRKREKKKPEKKKLKPTKRDAGMKKSRHCKLWAGNGEEEFSGNGKQISSRKRKTGLD